jgi:dihydrolipoamide dehydrogenase
MQTRQVDAIVIGAGTGGYPAAIRLGQLGKRVLIVEEKDIGGVCLNVGCIPSKALIYAADRYARSQEEAMGIRAERVSLDWAKLLSWKAGVTRKLTDGVAGLLKASRAEVLHGRATLVRPGQVRVETQESPVTVEAPNTIVATGSRPMELKPFPFDGQLVVSSTEALSFPEIPKRLLVIGGGYIGLELGMAYRKLGSEVTVLEMLDQVLPGFDADVVAVVARKMKRMGIAVHVGARAKSLEKGKEGARVLCESGGKEQAFTADKVLVTVGRRPVTEGFGLAEAGVKLDAKGFVAVDASRQTSVRGIYAVGDVAGEPMLAHKAIKEAEVAAEAIAGKHAAFDVRAIPAVVFTDPQIAVVGLSEAQAKAQGHAAATAKVSFGAIGRALAAGETDGFAKVIFDQKSGLLLGAQIVGPEASDLIAECALALELGADVGDLALTIHAHPTLPEAIEEAAKVAIGEPVHVLPRSGAAG